MKFLIVIFFLSLTTYCFSQATKKAPTKSIQKEKFAGVDLYPIKVNNLYGFINHLGQIIIKPQFENANMFKEGFAKIKISGKFGFIDKGGKISVNTIYEELQDYSFGLAKIKVNNKYGFIDYTGKVIIMPTFEYAESFSNIYGGLTKIKVSEKYGLINKKGEIISKPQFDNISFFNEGLAQIKIDRKSGFINLNGDIVIKPTFTWAVAFSEGLALVSNNEDWYMRDNCGYIDKKGDYVIKPQFGHLSGGFKNGMASVSVHGKYGYINKKGEFVIEPQFNFADDFNDGFASVSYSKEGGGYLAPDAMCGWIDVKGKFVINPIYWFSYGHFYEGLKAVRIRQDENYKTFYIDKTNKVIIEPDCEMAQDFKEGWARVTKRGFDGIINKKGEFFEGEIVGDLIRVKQGDNFGYKNKLGQWVWNTN